MRTFFFVVSLTFSVFIFSAHAQDKPANNREIIHEKLKADKKFNVAKYMELTKSEAKRFWPIYGEYQKRLAKNQPPHRRLAGELCGRFPQ